MAARLGIAIFWLCAASSCLVAVLSLGFLPNGFLSWLVNTLLFVVPLMAVGLSARYVLAGR